MVLKERRFEKTPSGWQNVCVYVDEIIIRKIAKNPQMSAKEFISEDKSKKCGCCKKNFREGNVWFVLTNTGATHLCDDCRNYFIENKK